MKHTETPWQYDVAGYGNIRPVKHTGKNICVFNRCFSKLEMDEQEANANFIVQAVNAHDELVEALKAIIQAHSLWKADDEATYLKLGDMIRDTIPQARAALALATLTDESVSGPSAEQCNDILGKPGHYS